MSSGSSSGNRNSHPITSSSGNSSGSPPNSTSRRSSTENNNTINNNNNSTTSTSSFRSSYSSTPIAGLGSTAAALAATRRLSYASVAAGVATPAGAPPSGYPRIPRSGFVPPPLAYSPPSTQNPLEGDRQQQRVESSPGTSAVARESHSGQVTGAQSAGVTRRASSPSRGGTITRMDSEVFNSGAGGGNDRFKSSTSAQPWQGDRMGCTIHDSHPPFFTPSYLRHSRHVLRLRRANDEHIAALQEQARRNPQASLSSTGSAVSLASGKGAAGGLGSQSSHSSLNKLYSHHHHHAHVRSTPALVDVIERVPPLSHSAIEDDGLHPLPSRWSDEDKMAGLEILGEGTEVRFAGVTKTQDEAASIRSDHPMPKECGLYYFEVTILSRGKDGLIGIGFSAKKASLNRLPGWETESWAYHGDDGYSFACTASGKAYGPRFSSNDVVGCGINFKTGNAFFTRNGVYLGTAFSGIKNERLYPSVGMKKPGEHLRINFGRQPFVFDINSMMEQERQAVLAGIWKFGIGSMRTADDERTIIHKLIGQYLAHEGYVETAKAFALDVREQAESMVTTDGQIPGLPAAEEDVHAINRQKIRRSILDGDIDRALKYTSSYYPHVLEEDRNQDVYFRLKCRKFIEMMRRYARQLDATSSPTAMSKSIDSAASNGRAEATQPGDTQMELDEQLHREEASDAGAAPVVPSDDIDMDNGSNTDLSPSSTKSSLMKQGDLLTAAITYGQEIQHEFGSDPRPQTKKHLQDLFAIIAYPNPATSPVATLLDPQGRIQIAEEVNGAILVSLGKPSSAALEKVCAQTEAFLDETASRTGGAAAFVHVKADFLQD